MLGFRTSEFSRIILFFILKSPFIMRFVFIHAKMTFCFFSKLHLIPSNNNQITRLMTHDKASKVFRSKFFFVLSCRFTAVIIFLRPRTSKIQLIKIIILKVCDITIFICIQVIPKYENQKLNKQLSFHIKRISIFFINVDRLSHTMYFI